MNKTIVAAATALSLVAGTGYADTAAPVQNDKMHCTNERNGDFNLHHESYDDPIAKISGDFNPSNNTISETWNNDSTRIVRLERAEAIANSSRTIWISEDFRGAFIALSDGSKTTFTADLNNETCSVETNQRLRGETKTVSMKMQ